jgi:hypothetical protein
MRFGSTYYFMVVAILEKHGYEVIRSIDQKTIYVSRYGKSSSGRELIGIFEREGLLVYLDYLEPQALSIWKVQLI